MKMIPVLRANDMKEAVTFYTKILDFALKYPGEADDDIAISLIKEDAELLLVHYDGTPRIPVLVMVDDVDASHKKYLDRGLSVPNNPDSPVHNSPIDQTWGLREFYVNDPSGNTLRFATPIR